MLKALKHNLNYAPPVAGYQAGVSGVPRLGWCDQPVRFSGLLGPPPPWSRIVNLAVFCMIKSTCCTRACPCKLTGVPSHDRPINLNSYYWKTLISWDSLQKYTYATWCSKHTIFFSKRRKNSLLCAHCMTAWIIE